MMEFTFEKTPWELTLEGLKPGSRLSAARFLTVMEGETESAVADALEELEEKDISLDITDLPRFACDGEGAQRLSLEEKLAKNGDLLSGLPENDPLRLYLEELAQLPAAGDPAVLAEKVAAGDEAACAMLVNLQLSRVVEEARNHTGNGVLLLDLIQEGSLGLWQGLQRYRTGDVEQYCARWIRRYMAVAVTMQARAAGVGEKMRKAMEDYRDVDQRLLTELGRNPTLEEMAEALHMTPQQTLAVAETVENAQLLQRAKGPEQPPEEDPEDLQAVEDTAYFQMRQRIAELLSTLTEEDARLLTLRYGLEGGLPMKPQQVALRLGITADEVTAREAAALAKLRNEQ